MSTEDAKAYLSNREVPRLFECLMTGLMFHRPNDHIQYLIESLEKVKRKGQAEMTWNMFVEVRSAKTPLPPITPDNGKRPVSRGRVTPKEESRPITPACKPAPLPPIGSSGLPNVPVVFIMGGPGCGKKEQSNRLAEKHPGWVNIHLGDLLRNEVSTKEADDKWRLAKEMVYNGELAPEELTLNLIFDHMKENMEANGYIIEGFPRDMEQAQAFEKMVGRIDAVFLLDCEEDTLTNIVLTRGQTSGRLDDSPVILAKRLATYREKTLPVLKNYDDSGKLYIIGGEQDEESVHDELSIIFETLLQNLENGRIPTPPLNSKPSSGRRSRKGTPCQSGPPLTPSSPTEPDVVITMPTVVFVPPPELKVKDEGRKSDLPQAPIIFITGGPGCGKGTQCKNITGRYSDIVHLSMGDILRKEISDKGSADQKWAMITKLLQEGDMAPVDVTDELLLSSMKEHPDAKAFIVEGYPRDIVQYENFNQTIGGQSFTILLDCDDNYLRDRLILRGGGGTDRIDDNIPAIEKKLCFYASHTLPLMKLIDDEGKLIVVDGDRDEQEIFFDLVKCLDFSLYGLALEETKPAATATAAAADDDDDGEKASGVKDGAGAQPEEEETDGRPVVVEEAMTSQNAPVPTGALIENPSYSAELDAAAKAAADEGSDDKAPVSAVDRQDEVDVGGGANNAKDDEEEAETTAAEDPLNNEHVVGGDEKEAGEQDVQEDKVDVEEDKVDVEEDKDVVEEDKDVVEEDKDVVEEDSDIKQDEAVVEDSSQSQNGVVEEEASLNKEEGECGTDKSTEGGDQPEVSNESDDNDTIVPAAAATEDASQEEKQEEADEKGDDSEKQPPHDAEVVQPRTDDLGADDLGADDLGDGKDAVIEEDQPDSGEAGNAVNDDVTLNCEDQEGQGSATETKEEGKAADTTKEPQESAEAREEAETETKEDSKEESKAADDSTPQETAAVEVKEESASKDEDKSADDTTAVVAEASSSEAPKEDESKTEPDAGKTE